MTRQSTTAPPRPRLTLLSAPERVARVRATGLLEHVEEEAFTRLARLGASVLQAPVIYIALVTGTHHDFVLGGVGLSDGIRGARAMDWTPTLAQRLALYGVPLLIEDMRTDATARLTEDGARLGVKAFLGAPLELDGHVIGAFCAADVKPRFWWPEDEAHLADLAAAAVGAIRLHEAGVRARSDTARMDHQAKELEAQAAQLETANEELRMIAKDLVATNEALQDSETRLVAALESEQAARQEAERANAAKAEFLAVMSHEVRTPLNAITGYAEILALGLRGELNEAQRGDLERIQRSSHHLLGLINEVLKFARLEAGRIETHIEPVSVDDVIESVEAVVRPAFAAKGLAYVYEQPPERLHVLADVEKLRQVLINLLANAAKFTERGGVTVSVRADGETIAITVRDTGRGIPSYQIDKIFEPFVQIDRHRTPSGQQGLGLGLAISRDLMDAMRGRLAVESKPGVGSAFTVSLPRTVIQLSKRSA